MENTKKLNVVKPTPQQLEWAEQEVGVIIHFVANIYNPEYDVKQCLKENRIREVFPASSFAPQGWDTDQWLRSAAEMGAKYAVLVANHCVGFSLWPTKANDYSVASCAYQNGEGDIVRDFMESCKKYGIKPGIYYSTGCNGYYGINEVWEGKDFYSTERGKEYARIVEQQLTELWSQYGELFEIWFDGGVMTAEHGGPDVISLLKKYQPNAVCFQGPAEWPHKLRWVGNEDGLAADECWGTTHYVDPTRDGETADESLQKGDIDGKYYCPAEADMGNRFHEAYFNGWGWKAGESNMVYSPEHLLDCYIQSVGKNCNLLLGMAIAQDGRFEDVEQFAQFGKLLRKTFGDEARIAEQEGTSELVQTMALSEPADLKYVVLREDMTEGHCIRKFRITCDGNVMAEGECVGHKRICKISAKEVQEVTVEILEYNGQPKLRDITVY